MLTSTYGRWRLGQVARRLPAVRLKVAPSPCCCRADDLYDMIAAHRSRIGGARTSRPRGVRSLGTQLLSHETREAWSCLLFVTPTPSTEHHHQIDKTCLITRRNQTSKRHVPRRKSIEIHFLDLLTGSCLMCTFGEGEGSRVPTRAKTIRDSYSVKRKLQPSRIAPPITAPVISTRSRTKVRLT
jgi:hypothetical protein